MHNLSATQHFQLSQFHNNRSKLELALRMFFMRMFSYALEKNIRIAIYGSVSAGREFWPFRVTFFQKVEPLCDQT